MSGAVTVAIAFQCYTFGAIAPADTIVTQSKTTARGCKHESTEQWKWLGDSRWAGGEKRGFSAPAFNHNKE